MPKTLTGASILAPASAHAELLVPRAEAEAEAEAEAKAEAEAEAEEVSIG